MQIMDSPERYGATTRLIHWSMALLILGMLTTGVFKELVEDSPLEHTLMAYHKSIGIVILGMLLLRLVWRRLNPSAAIGSSVSRIWVRLGHATLYLVMFLMPLSGLLLAWGSGHGIEFFGHPFIAPGARIEWAHELGEGAHEAGQFLLWALIGGHIGAALYHRFVKRDAVMQRML